MIQLSLFDPIEIFLTKGLIALVDPIDADLRDFNWHGRTPTGNRSGIYAARTLRFSGRCNTVFMHRIILERTLGRSLNANEYVDHIEARRRPPSCSWRSHEAADNWRSLKRASPMSPLRSGIAKRQPTIGCH